MAAHATRQGHDSSGTGGEGDGGGCVTGLRQALGGFALGVVLVGRGRSAGDNAVVGVLRHGQVGKALGQLLLRCLLGGERAVVCRLGIGNVCLGGLELLHLAHIGVMGGGERLGNILVVDASGKAV